MNMHSPIEAADQLSLVNAPEALEQANAAPPNNVAQIRQVSSAEAPGPASADNNDDDGEVCLVPNQEIILARLDKQTGDLWLKQINWPNEDAVITVSRELLPMFTDQLCDLLGIGSFGGRR